MTIGRSLTCSNTTWIHNCLLSCWFTTDTFIFAFSNFPTTHLQYEKSRKCLGNAIRHYISNDLHWIVCVQHPAISKEKWSGVFIISLPVSPLANKQKYTRCRHITDLIKHIFPLCFSLSRKKKNKIDSSSKKPAAKYTYVITENITVSFFVAHVCWLREFSLGLKILFAETRLLNWSQREFFGEEMCKLEICENAC